MQYNNFDLINQNCMTIEEFKHRFLPLNGKLYKTAFYLLTNEDDAKDAVQDLYVKLWEMRDKLTNILDDEAYCVSAIRNECLNILKKNINSTSFDPLTELNDVINYDSPELQYISDEELIKIYDKIKLLSDVQKKILILKQFNNCSFEEISTITGLSEANIRVILSRARKKLKKLLDEDIL